jgi:uncharacterized membrane protein
MKKLFLNWLVIEPSQGVTPLLSPVLALDRDEGPIKFCQAILTIIADCKVIINVMAGFTCCMHAGSDTDSKNMANCHESEQ